MDRALPSHELGAGLTATISGQGCRIRGDVIRSELLLDEGDPYSKVKLNKSISKLKSRNIFKKVSHFFGGAYLSLQGEFRDESSSTRTAMSRACAPRR